MKDVARFDQLLQTGLKSGANKIDSVDFSTSELRKYRDQARAMAVKAAIEKAHDVAKAGDFRIAEKPLTVNASNSSVYWPVYGYGRYSGYMQNAVQNVGGAAGTGDSVALGKISVSASVTMVFEIQ